MIDYENNFMRFFTRTGDKGETCLGDGKKTSKNSLRVEVNGNLDELNSLIGIIIAQIKNEDIKNILLQIQNDFFIIGAEIASNKKEKINYKIPILTAHHTKKIEKFTNEITNQLEPLNKFILPGGSLNAAFLQTARAVCRRTERSIVALSKKEKINEEILKYCNRLSSLLFVLARFENKNLGIKETEWNF
jgi:cob(I)alamin adenosyltransferase